MNLIITESNYTLLIYFLITDVNQEYRILSKKKIIQSDKNILVKLRKNLLWRLFGNLVIDTILKKLGEKKINLYGNDHTLIGNIFLNYGNFILLEDGTENYSLKNFKKEKKIKSLLRKKLKINKSYGIDDRVKKIYLTGLAPVPKEIAHKVEIINLKELWSKKSLEEQNEILDIFSFDLNIKETIKDRDIILFTQPLSEDRVITEQEKINIYSKIIKKYPQDRLIIKTHPREKTNYKEIFKDNLVLDNPFPFEILNLLDAKFNKAVTLFSTAALGLGEGVEVDFYGTEVNDKILARFGSCDNIMKRNSYLEEEE
ncbi:MAG: glycosyltransferase family 52 [Cetobacterium sp.]